MEPTDPRIREAVGAPKTFSTSVNLGGFSMMNDTSFRFPFEDFWINPVTSWQRFFNPQFFITYNSGDAELENHVLSRVGSYGKQLGCIVDALEVLVAHLPLERLTPIERNDLSEFCDFARDIDRAIADYRGQREEGMTPVRVEQFIEDLAGLERSDPESYRRLTDRLQEALGSMAKLSKGGRQGNRAISADRPITAIGSRHSGKPEGGV